MTTLAQVLPPEREAHFQNRVINAMRVFGWRVYHPWTSIHSASGWPDLFAVRGERGVAAELKAVRGRVTPAQQDWLDCLSNVRGIEAYVWRPSDWDQIVEILR